MKKIRVNWKKTIIVALDVVLAAYLVLAFTAFNKPDETSQICSKVSIQIEDEADNGFITTSEIKNRLLNSSLYPINKPLTSISARSIEETLMRTPFVKTAECYKTQDGQVNISISQRVPVVRIKSETGADYYLDDNDCIMPNSHYTSDLIIATGNISTAFATRYVSPMSRVIMKDAFWKNQIEQINVRPDHGIELVPRVGNHIIYIGQLPQHNDKEKRQKLIEDFVGNKLKRLDQFYKYGLSQAGWNKYAVINLEYDNQIICKKHPKDKK